MAISRKEIREAVGFLGNSQEGREIAAMLVAFLEQGGLSLDMQTKAAVVQILRGAFLDHPDFVMRTLLALFQGGNHENN